MKAYKGFNKDMTCRGFQFEEGKIYETEAAEMCGTGFHACENPLDCFGYYSPGDSVYHEVEIEDNGQRTGEDSKVVGTKIKIGARLDVAGICKAHFEFVKSRCDHVNGRVCGNKEAVSVGDHASASAGEYGSAVSRGSVVVGKCGAGLVRGNSIKAKGGLGSIIVICVENDDNYEINDWKVGVVDGVNLKPETWYTLINGEFVEVQEC